MPHLHIEVSPALATAIDWGQLTRKIHQELAAKGCAALNDLKSRVLVCHHTLAGNDAQAQQIVATLITTNPRPQHELERMQGFVLSALQSVIEDLAPDHWVQCCVFLQPIPKTHYAKWQWHPSPSS